METTIPSKAKSVVIGFERPFVIIGERINPSGYERLREALNRGDLSLLREEAVDLPLSIDTANHEALAGALAVCPGKPLVNSVTGEEASLETVLPLVKERGCAVIGLCMDEEGIPKKAQRWLEIARKSNRPTDRDHQ